jgi:hypothetical protein
MDRISSRELYLGSGLLSYDHLKRTFSSFVKQGIRLGTEHRSQLTESSRQSHHAEALDLEVSRDPFKSDFVKN